MDIDRVTRGGYVQTIFVALLISCLVVAIAATLGRATINLKAALVDQPDLAIYLLLPDENIRATELLRNLGDERHYLAETAEGPKLVILKKGEREWFVSEVEELRE